VKYLNNVKINFILVVGAKNVDWRISYT
jgi:hypothetical protein